MSVSEAQENSGLNMRVAQDELARLKLSLESQARGSPPKSQNLKHLKLFATEKKRRALGEVVNSVLKDSVVDSKVLKPKSSWGADGRVGKKTGKVDLHVNTPPVKHCPKLKIFEDTAPEIVDVIKEDMIQEQSRKNIQELGCTSCDDTNLQNADMPLEEEELEEDFPEPEAMNLPPNDDYIDYCNVEPPEDTHYINADALNLFGPPEPFDFNRWFETSLVIIGEFETGLLA